MSKKLSKNDLVELLDKASGILELIVSELPDDSDDIDSPLSYLFNAIGDIQDAVNIISDDSYVG